MNSCRKLIKTYGETNYGMSSLFDRAIQSLALNTIIKQLRLTLFYFYFFKYIDEEATVSDSLRLHSVRNVSSDDTAECKQTYRYVEALIDST